MSTLSKSVIAALFLLGLPGITAAHDYRAGSIRVEHPWAIATPNGAKTGAGFMKITNDGKESDYLIAITSSAAPKMSLHAMVTENGVTKMRKLDRLEIKPGETIEMKPEGSHIMFEGLGKPLIEASRVQGKIVFEKAGSVDVDYTIVPMGTKLHSD